MVNSLPGGFCRTKGLEEAVSVVLWLTERSVERLSNGARNALFHHPTQTMVRSGRLLNPSSSIPSRPFNISLGTLHISLIWTIPCGSTSFERYPWMQHLYLSERLPGREDEDRRSGSSNPGDADTDTDMDNDPSPSTPSPRRDVVE
jgi:hypothetical protein